VRTAVNCARWGGAAAVLLGALLALPLLGAPAARAGSWIQVSCVNPDGTAAPSEGWTSFATAGVSPLSATSPVCSPTQPMLASLSNLAAVPSGASENLQYTPPAGSTLAGGTLAVTLSADGGSEFGRAVASVNEPGNDVSAGDMVFGCVEGLGCTGTSGASDFTGPVTLPAGRGGNLYVTALCTALANSNCSTGGTDGAFAFARISSADLSLSNTAVPNGADFSGSALQPRVHGTAHLVFTAGDPAGPGVYIVQASLDGSPFYSTTPNTNGGACVPVGSIAGALMFDHQQPCPRAAAIDAAVPTAGLPDGAHRLTVTVVDAASNLATVLDQNITTFNPAITPLPRRSLKARFVISWRWSPNSTLLRSITTRKLPPRARVTLRCAGLCPRLRVHSVPARNIKRLLRALRDHRFHAGDKLHLTVTERHHRTERIELAIRAGKIPRATLVGRRSHHPKATHHHRKVKRRG
jgi:hypothetical protein